MTDGPIRASEVDKKADKPDPETLKDKARSAVQRRASRREAMDRLGLTGQGTPGLVEKIEAQSRKASEERMAAFRASRGSGAVETPASAAAKAAVKTRMRGTDAPAGEGK